MRFLVLLVALLIVSSHPAPAQPAGPTCAPNTNSPACQAPAVNFQPTDILLGQQATGPSRANQTVQVSPLQIVDAAGGGALRTCPPPLGLGQDDGPNLRNCIAGSNVTAIVPPGTYLIKTFALTPPGPVNFPASAIQISAQQNVAVYAYGATFTIDPSVPSPGGNFVGIMRNSKQVAWSGGTFVVSRAGIGSGNLNNAMCWESVTNLSIKDVVFSGAYTPGSAMCGVYGFGVTIDNVKAYAVSLGLDGAFNQDLIVRGSLFTGSTVSPNNAIANGYDAPTQPTNVVTNPDGSPRSLRYGQANNLQFINNTIVGFSEAVAVNDTNGALIAGNTIRDGLFSSGYNDGIVLYANTAGHITQSIIVTDNVITNNGKTGGCTNCVNGGVLLNPNAIGLNNVTIVANRIFDNCGDGITNASATGGMGQINVVHNDFTPQGGACTQASAVNPPLVAALGYTMRMTGNVGNGAEVQNMPVADGYSGLSLAGGHPRLMFQQDNNMVLYSTGAGGADRPIASVPMDSATSEFTFLVPGFVISNTAATGTNLALQGVAGQTKGFGLYTGNSIRWQMEADGTAEAGSNAGSNFVLARYSDAGIQLGNPSISIVRQTGAMTLDGTALSITSLPTTCTGNSGKIAAVSGVLNLCP